MNTAELYGRWRVLQPDWFSQWGSWLDRLEEKSEEKDNDNNDNDKHKDKREEGNASSSLLEMLLRIGSAPAGDFDSWFC